MTHHLLPDASPTACVGSPTESSTPLVYPADVTSEPAAHEPSEIEPTRRRYEQVQTEGDGAIIAESSVDEEDLSSVPSSCCARFGAGTLFQVLVAGAGFACDAYDLFVMNLVLVVLRFEYDAGAASASLLATAVLVGSVAGQLIFGVLADHVGRRAGFIATLSLLTVGATLSALSFGVGSFTTLHCLALWRFVLGVGIGGEYPLAATVSSEASAHVSGRGRRVAAVFSMQGIGAVLAPLVVLALLGIAGPGHTGLVWRLALGAGALPGAVMIYFRLRMTESRAFTQARREAQQAAADAESENGASARGKWSAAWRSAADATSAKAHLLASHWRALLGTAGNWFIFDVVFYANGLFSSTVLAHWYARPERDDPDAVHHYLVQVALATLALSVCALPGYWSSVFAIDALGRRRLQLIGYAGMVTSYTVCGAFLPLIGDNGVGRALFFFLYALTFFFCNFGPNVTTFVIPSEAFPTEVRATAHGLSAAAGKMGAVLGGAVMPALLATGGRPSDDDGGEDVGSLARVMYLCAGVSALGGLWTLAFTRETRDLELAPPAHPLAHAAIDAEDAHEIEIASPDPSPKSHLHYHVHAPTPTDRSIAHSSRCDSDADAMSEYMRDTDEEMSLAELEAQLAEL